MDSTRGTSVDSSESENPPVDNASRKRRYLCDEEVRELLRERGFADAGTDSALHLLSRVSYQHLSPYLTAVEKAGCKKSLKHAHDLLTLDRRFQSMAFKYIGMFETQFRAAYSSAMAREHGDFALYDAGVFLRGDLYGKTRSAYDAEVLRKARRSPLVKQELADNGGMMPVWHSVEFMTLGTLSKFFSNTGDRAVTRSVLDSFGVRKREFSSWVRTITAARNIFAHFGHYLVSSQIPSIPLSVHGAGMPNTAPLYLVVLLYRLLDAPDVSGDPNMRYAERLRDETLALLGSFYGTYGDSVSVPGIPDDWRSALSFWDMRSV